MDRGYVKLYRKLMDAPVWKNEGLLRFWLWCLMRANYRTTVVGVTTGRGNTTITLDPGQFIFGRNQASQELSVPPSTIRNQISKLCSLKMIDQKPDTHFSIITIVNWASYQMDDEEEDRRRTGKGQAKDNQRTGKGHREEGKEGKEGGESKEVKDFKKENPFVGQARLVIDLLNKKTGKNFRHTPANLKFAIARLNDGFTVDDFANVFDAKVKEWTGTEWERFLRPETLLGTKFDGYLQAAKFSGQPTGGSENDPFAKILGGR